MIKIKLQVKFNIIKLIYDIYVGDDSNYPDLNKKYPKYHKAHICPYLPSLYGILINILRKTPNHLLCLFTYDQHCIFCIRNTHEYIFRICITQRYKHLPYTYLFYIQNLLTSYWKSKSACRWVVINKGNDLLQLRKVIFYNQGGCLKTGNI